ncbi:hypothetical protein GJ496_000400 [Pomphorhynchus laevis]|nr:hypothetical protein GJ496_000400 [Pomphorhynchus laevis]
MSSSTPFKRRRCNESRKNIRNAQKSQSSNSSSSQSDNDIKLKSAKPRICTTLKCQLPKKIEPIIESFSSSGVKSLGPSDQGATLLNEIDTPFDRDEQAIQEKAIKINKDLLDSTIDDKVYRGLNYYQQFIEKKDTAVGNAASGLVRRKGPIRAPMNVRVTTRWDYQPDICKDYKETGFCGFGDSCKFLHDRSDYKFGWQLEQEENFARSGNDNQPGKDFDRISSSDDDHEELPFKCIICRQSFTNPVATKCLHYFCESCALENYKQRGSRCFACGSDTEGRFTTAKRLLSRIENAQQNCEQSSTDDD